MSNFFHALQVDDVLRFRDFEGKVVRRLDDAVAVVDASGAETVLTFAELDRLKDETVVSFERITKKTEAERVVTELLWKAVTDVFLDLEKRGRTTRWIDDFIWKVVPQLNEAMLAEARRLRPLYGEWVRAEPGGVTPHCLRERLRIIESRRLLVVIPGGKA